MDSLLIQRSRGDDGTRRPLLPLRRSAARWHGERDARSLGIVVCGCQADGAKEGTSTDVWGNVWGMFLLSLPRLQASW